MKIGIGVTSFKRLNSLKQFLSKVSILDKTKYEIAVVLDGPRYENICYDSFLDEIFQENMEVYTFYYNVGVARTKNKCIDILRKKNVNYYFLFDDDIDILDINVFDFYIDAIKFSNIKHFLFSHIDNNPSIATLMLSETNGLTVHQHAKGAVMIFEGNHLDIIGEYDIGFKNALEHVDLTYRSYLKQELPFWGFLDVLGSERFLKDQNTESTITDKELYNINKQKSALYWYDKYNSQIIDIPKFDINVLIEKIRK